MKWILKYMMRLPARRLAVIALMILKEIAQRTDNKIDDEAVEVFESILDAGFNEDVKEAV